MCTLGKAGDIPECSKDHLWMVEFYFGFSTFHSNTAILYYLFLILYFSKLSTRNLIMREKIQVKEMQTLTNGVKCQRGG